MRKEQMITRKAYEKLLAELDEMKTTKRAQIAEEIKIAREFGDISENAEYETAKNDQALLEAQIADIEEDMSRMQVVDKIPRSKDGSADIGSRVSFEVQGGKKEEALLVSTFEADVYNGKLSLESPIGKALLGSRPGDEVVATLPSGKKKKIKVLKIK